MWMLYLDDSGHGADPKVDFSVYAGVAVFERQTHWVDQRLESVASAYQTGPEPVEFHGSEMWGRRGDWRTFDPAQRSQAFSDVLAVLANKKFQLRVFAAVVENQLHGRKAAPILEKLYEDVACRFDDFLANFYQSYKLRERGLVIFDQNSAENKIQALSTVFKNVGHSTGKLRNFAEVPLFLNSKASRLIQLADCIAYQIFRFFQHSDRAGYDVISPYFYNKNGNVLGLTLDVSQGLLANRLALPPPQYPLPPPAPF